MIDLTGVRILVVDDTYHNRLLINMMLKPFGAKIHAAQNSEEFFDFMSKEVFDVILMDIQLAEKLTGVDLARHVDEFFPNNNVILQTAYEINQSYSDIKCVKSLIRKPIKLETLITTIQRVIKNDNRRVC